MAQRCRLGKKTFSTYLFQLSGCKFLLPKLMELPLISVSPAGGVCTAEPPAAILNKLLTGYETHKTTKEYRDAVHQAKEHQKCKQRLSHKLWWAQYNFAQGEKLSDMVGDGDIDFDDLHEIAAAAVGP